MFLLLSVYKAIIIMKMMTTMMMMMIGVTTPAIMGPSFLSVLGSTESIIRINILINSCIHTHS